MFGPFGIPMPQPEVCCKTPMTPTTETKEHGYRWQSYKCGKCGKLAMEKVGPIYSEEDLDVMEILGGYPWA